MNDEEWVPVGGFPGYSVNPLGQVRKDSSGRVLHTRLNQYGVPYVGLMRNWRQCIRSLPRLVATAFLPTSNVIFDTPINLDGDRTNCAVDNLMWRPRWYAIYYVNQFKDRYAYPIEAPVRAIETEEEFVNSLEAACRYGLLEREVVLSVLNKTPTWPTYQMFELVDMP
jgi:hypothetical protein